MPLVVERYMPTAILVGARNAGFGFERMPLLGAAWSPVLFAPNVPVKRVDDSFHAELLDLEMSSSVYLSGRIGEDGRISDFHLSVRGMDDGQGEAFDVALAAKFGPTDAGKLARLATQGTDYCFESHPGVRLRKHMQDRVLEVRLVGPAGPPQRTTPTPR
jgi:hypothetical protein